jgi:hypothetical protein
MPAIRALRKCLPEMTKISCHGNNRRNTDHPPASLMPPQDYSHLDLRNRSFKHQDLTGANFSYSDLRGCDFSGATLIGANFQGCKTGHSRRQFLLRITIAMIVASFAIYRDSTIIGSFNALIGAIFIFPLIFMFAFVAISAFTNDYFDLSDSLKPILTFVITSFFAFTSVLLLFVSIWVISWNAGASTIAFYQGRFLRELLLHYFLYLLSVLQFTFFLS